MESRSDGILLDPIEELPLVSIVVPVWNGEAHLRESLDSILAQTYPQLEVIVVDDASTDSTPEILASYGDRIRVHRQQSTRGIYGNANDGIALACGEREGEDGGEQGDESRANHGSLLGHVRGVWLLRM